MFSLLSEMNCSCFWIWFLDFSSLSRKWPQQKRNHLILHSSIHIIILAIQPISHRHIYNLKSRSFHDDSKQSDWHLLFALVFHVCLVPNIQHYFNEKKWITKFPITNKIIYVFFSIVIHLYFGMSRNDQSNEKLLTKYAFALSERSHFTSLIYLFK